MGLVSIKNKDLKISIKIRVRNCQSISVNTLEVFFQVLKKYIIPNSDKQSFKY